MNKIEAHKLFQGGYYDPIDRGDAASAVEVMARDVAWSHISAWQSDDLGFSLTALDELASRQEVSDFLDIAAPKVAENGLLHKVTELIVDDTKGAFLCEVTSSHKTDVAHFMVWFELDADGLVSRYVMRPI